MEWRTSKAFRNHGGCMIAVIHGQPGILAPSDVTSLLVGRSRFPGSLARSLFGLM